MDEVIDSVTGDVFGLRIPAHPNALQLQGEDFLTEAFHLAGSIEASHRVRRVVRFEECPGGSTGRKLRMSVEYDNPDVSLPTDLFVKFSRDFSDPIRDRAKIQMESEVRIALLSRIPEFPVAVPRCLFADYHRESGTGILVTEEIKFGEGGIERHYGKCLDADLPDPLGHYRALVRAIARLAGAYRAGRFPSDVMDQIERQEGSLGVSDRQHYSAEQIQRRVERYHNFAARYPRLLPDAIRSESFLIQFAEQAPRFCGHEREIAEFLANSGKFKSLCHWNANIDNAWFWRDESDVLQCGLMDWGNARVMNMGVALAGCLMGAEPDFLVQNLDALLGEFTSEFENVSGEALDPVELKKHLILHNASSGLLWLIDAPTMIERYFPRLNEIESRFDPRFRRDELVRNQLHMLTVFLTLWKALDFGAILEDFNARRPT